jgi:ATP-dependent Clp endopeptidase proteolytic subunit ClpP
MLDSDVNDQVASVICSELLYCESKGDGDITLYINSPGGSISAGMAIHDTMRYIKPDVSVVCMETVTLSLDDIAKYLFENKRGFACNSLVTGLKVIEEPLTENFRAGRYYY